MHLNILFSATLKLSNSKIIMNLPRRRVWALSFFVKQMPIRLSDNELIQKSAFFSFSFQD